MKKPRQVLEHPRGQVDRDTYKEEIDMNDPSGARPDEERQTLEALRAEIESLRMVVLHGLARENHARTALVGRVDVYGELAIHAADGSTTTIQGGRLIVSGPRELSAKVLLLADDIEAGVSVHAGEACNAMAGLTADGGMAAEGFPATAELILVADEGRSAYRREAKGSLAEVTA